MSNIIIRKPVEEDLPAIEKILSEWTDESEVKKYIERIGGYIKDKTEFNAKYWVAVDNDIIVGITGICDVLPKIVEFAKTEKPCELKILYLEKDCRGKGIGRTLLSLVEEKAKDLGFTEIMGRSAERYRDTAYAFYEKMGYENAGVVCAGEDKSKLMRVIRKELGNRM